MSTICLRTGCDKPAESAIGIEFYPMKSFMGFYKQHEPITRLIVGICVCDEHLREFDVKDFFSGEQGNGVISVVEKSTGVTVDRNGFKVVPIAFDDPEYLKLLAARGSDHG